MADTIYGYVPKDNLGVLIITPVPTELNKYYKIKYDPKFNYVNKVYCPTTNTWDKDIDKTNNIIAKQRADAYAKESDPLYMEWQFDQTEIARQIWVAKVHEIKARFPYITK